MTKHKSHYGKYQKEKDWCFQNIDKTKEYVTQNFRMDRCEKSLHVLNLWKTHTLREIAKKLGVTKQAVSERIGQICIRAYYFYND